MIRTHLLPLLFICFSCLPAGGTVLYVNTDVQGGNADGTSWADAFPMLQSALVAAQYGDTIWVAQGTYLPTTGTNRFVSFTLKNGIRMFGGFTGTESSLDERDWEAYPTVLSGDIGAPDDSTDNSYNVVFCNLADSTTVLDGFIITGGNADDPSPGQTTVRSKSGGGLHLVGSSQAGDTRPVIINCKFIGNHARFNGGGMFVRTVLGAGATPTLINCEFRENSATRGGGLYKDGGSVMQSMVVEGCEFIENRAWDTGGGFSFYNTNGSKDVQVINCTFLRNHAIAIGGGIALTVTNSQSKLELKSSFFLENEDNPSLEGSAIGLFDVIGVNSLSLDIDSCLFSLNKTIGEVIAFYSFGTFIKINNSTFFGNIYTKVGLPTGACIRVLGSTNSPNKLIATNCHFDKSLDSAQCVVFASQQAELEFINCTFTSNDTPNGAIYLLFAMPHVTFNNSIFNQNTLNNNGKLFSAGGSQLTISHCLADIPDCSSYASGPVTCGPGMLYLSDPLFLDTAASDFRLHPCSPAIDAGDNAVVDSLGILTDIAGLPRIQGGTVDMGAHEAPAFAATAAAVQQLACPGDSGSVTLLLQHGCPPFFIEWDGGSAVSDSATAILLALPPGTHAVTVTDGRLNADTLTISIGQAPPPLGAGISANDILCPAGPAGSIVALPTGGTAPYTFLWSSGDTEGQVNVSLPGTYALTLTDVNGCTLTDSVAVAVQGILPLSISIVPVSCHDSSDGSATVTAIGGTAPFAWAWAGGHDGPLLDGIGGGSYAVTVTDAIGCTGTLNFTVSPPGAMLVEVQHEDVACAGGQDGSATAVPTGGTPPYSFLWSSGAATATAAGLPAGWHTVTVTDANGCTAGAGATISEPDSLTAAIAAPALLCFGETGTAAALPGSGTPPYTYLWQGPGGTSGQTDSLLTGLPPGTYGLTVTDANGCTQSAQAVTGESPPIQVLFEITNATAAGAPDGGVTLELTFGGSPPYAHLWSNGDTTASLTGVPPGSYQLTVTDAGGCTAVFHFTVDIGTAAGERPATAGFSAAVVPNPTGASPTGAGPTGRAGTARLVLTGVVSPKMKLAVYDAAGRLVSGPHYFTGNEHALPGGLAAGVYWVVVENERGERTAVAWMVVR